MPPPAPSHASEPGEARSDASLDHTPSPRSINKQSWDYIWRNQLAGGLAGCAAKTVVGPLDRVKILFQTSSPQFAKYSGSWAGAIRAMREIYRSEGVAKGLFRGHSATLLRIYPYAAIKFVAYEQVRALVIRGPEQESAARRALSGAAAGVVSVLCTYPLELIRVRLAFETKTGSRSSLRAICSQIYSERPSSSPSASTLSPLSALADHYRQPTRLRGHGGLSNFYRGFMPTLWGMLPYAGMSFLTHDTLGDVLRHASVAHYTTQASRSTNTNTNMSTSATTSSSSSPPPQLLWWAQLLRGGVAGIVAQTASYPLEVLRRRMQVGGVVGDGHRLRMGETARLILRERGLRGFWVGLGIGFLKVVPMTATSFFVYERLKAALEI
ncbi:MAG: hypothetical protein M1829_004908 [Trizodia sp. TS-e1964]|nr:MAG: hypothetical protein M1829_004908 [Trizodia sp. TS-e1964]